MADAATADTVDAPAGEKPAPRGIPKLRGKTKLLLILISLVGMAVLRTGFMFIIIGMLPSIVMHYMDVSKHRFTFRTVFAANLSGMMPFIGKMLHQGPSSQLLQDIMGSGATWGIIYASAFMGWLLVQICPMIAQGMIVGYHQSQIGRMRYMQRKIENEWGPEVTQFSKEPEPAVDDI